MGKLIFVSYRLPIVPRSCEKEDGHVTMEPLHMLNSAIEGVKSESKVIWIGTCHISNPSEAILETLKSLQFRPVILEPELEKLHFNVFCKGVLWPLFHYYSGGVQQFSQESWSAFLKVNEIFANEVSKVYTDGDSIIIQDYHLIALPGIIRNMIPNARIGFFLHVPWPTSELYRSLPVREDVLQYLLGADLIGFQTFPYARHFLSAVTRILGHAANERGVELPDGHFVSIDVAPVGIEPKNYIKVLESEDTKNQIESLKKRFEGKKVIIARDRMEYIQGIPHKLRAFDAFLSAYPEWRQKVVMLLECNPHADVFQEKDYKDLCEEVDKIVGSINGKFATIEYSPIHYLNRAPKSEESIALMAIADVALVTPLRDGMNTTAFEFIVCQKGKKSPLVLSEFAGAANCLSGAILTNPWDQARFIENIQEALTLREDYKVIRYNHNLDYVMSHTSTFWLANFFNQLKNTTRAQKINKPSHRLNMKDCIQLYKKSQKRLLLVDYDGTLVPITKMPNLAVPSEEIISILQTLCQNSKTIVYVITGRERRFMEEWFSGMNVGLSCEHGSFFRPYAHPGEETKQWINCASELDLSWKPAIKAIFDDYTDRTPGAFVETKENGVSWHYRNADPEFGEYQKNDLMVHLQDLPNLPIDIVAGKKVVEVRPQGISKGSVIRKILGVETGIDWVICMGDDRTDEDMFEEVNKCTIESKWTISVEKKQSTKARHYVDNQRAVVELLSKLAYS